MNTARRPAPVAVIGAAASVFAAVWSALVGFEIVVPAAPEGSGADLAADLRAYWVWYAGTVPARQATSFLLLIALVALALVAANLAVTRVSSMAAGGVVAGAVFWAIAACVRLGTDRAIALLATHDNPIDPTTSIAFASSWIATGFEMFGSLLVGGGLIAHAAGTAGRRPLAIATGLGLVVLSICLYLPVEELQVWMQLVAGAVLVPWWLLVEAAPVDLSMKMSINSIDD